MLVARSTPILSVFAIMATSPAAIAEEQPHDHSASSTPPSPPGASATPTRPGPVTSFDAGKSRWSGSEASLQAGASLLSFDRSAEPTYNPEVWQSLSVDPKYRVNDRLSLAGNISVETELSNNDVTTKKNEPLLGDIYVQGTVSLPKLPREVGSSAWLRLLLPTSKESQAREKYFTLSSRGTLDRTFKLTDNVELSARAGLQLTWHNAASTTLTYDAPTIRSCAAPRDSCDALDHSGVRSASWSVSERMGASISFTKLDLEVSAQVNWTQSRLFDLDDATNPVTGEPIPESSVNTDWRYSNQYSLGAEWQVHKHARLGLGLNTINPQQKPDSTYYRPFINRYTTVYVTAAAVL